MARKKALCVCYEKEKVYHERNRAATTFLNKRKRFFLLFVLIHYPHFPFRLALRRSEEIKCNNYVLWFIKRPDMAAGGMQASWAESLKSNGRKKKNSNLTESEISVDLSPCFSIIPYWWGQLFRRLHKRKPSSANHQSDFGFEKSRIEKKKTEHVNVTRSPRCTRVDRDTKKTFLRRCRKMLLFKFPA